MVWFKVDDSFYDHPKMFDAPDCAVALWTRAGSWCARNLTDGFVPSKMPARLCDDPDTAVAELLRRGMWTRTRNGYVFHQWTADGDGTPRNPTRSEVTASRSKQSSGGAIGNHRRWHVDRGVSDPKCRYCQTSDQGKHDRSTDRVTDRWADRRTDREPIGGTESPPNPPGPARPDPSSTDADASIESARARAPVDDFDLTDPVRRTVLRTFGPALDIDHEYAQFVSHFRAKGETRKNWPEAFIKWCRDSTKHASERAGRPTPGSATPRSTTEERVQQAAAIAAELRAEEAHP